MNAQTSRENTAQSVNYHFDHPPISAKLCYWYRNVLQTEILIPVFSYESKGIISQWRIREYRLNQGPQIVGRETFHFESRNNLIMP